METAKVEPTVNQILLCPGVTQEQTVSYSRKYNMLPIAYSPLGAGKDLKHPFLLELSKKYAKSCAQISIRWSLQMGFLPIPKTSNCIRMKENADIFDFYLSEDDISKLGHIRGFSAEPKDPDTVEF